jgi:hypothetical protein
LLSSTSAVVGGRSAPPKPAVQGMW